MPTTPRSPTRSACGPARPSSSVARTSPRFSPTTSTSCPFRSPTRWSADWPLPWRPPGVKQMPDRVPQFETRWRPLGSAVPSPGDQAPRPGELRFATAIPPAVVPEPSSSRLVLVMEVDSADGTALVMLTTNEIEMACDQDFVLPAEQIDLPFPISVQSDLVGAVWISQLENPIASVPHETLRALVAFRHGAAAADLLPCQGLPVDGPHDPRWQFKLQELWAIQALSASCISHVL